MERNRTAAGGGTSTAAGVPVDSQAICYAHEDCPCYECHDREDESCMCEIDHLNQTPACPGCYYERSCATCTEKKLFQRAVSLANEHKEVSISMLQRNLFIGYRTGHYLIGLMDSQGMLGPKKIDTALREFLGA